MRNVDADALRTTPLYAVHTYVPAWFLFTLLKTRSFPTGKFAAPSSGLVHCMVGSGNPLALQKKPIESPSLIVLFIGVMNLMVGDTKEEKET